MRDLISPRALVLAVLLLAPPAGAASPTQHLPADVQAFIKRVAECNTPHHLDGAGRAYWTCDRLAADRSTLITRYRRQPDIVQALKRPWKIRERGLILNFPHR